MLNIDLDLIRKYDKPGPRYTSYPTAPQFSEDFSKATYLDEIISTNHGEDLPDLSLYFHLPYCDTLCYFCGCNMLVSNDRNRINKYIKYLKEEINVLKKFLLSKRKVAQVHWGGGTPTHLLPDEIRDLKSFINQSFNIVDNAEQSCEIDPRELTYEHLQSLRENGFNRISMGVQDFNPKVQEAVNRIQPEEMTRNVVSWVKELEFESINLDIMYGLPHQTIDDFEKTVDSIVDMSPDRIALFNYAHVPWMKKHMNLIKQEDLPLPEEKLNILKMSVEKLVSAGYVFIGMDHFAKPDDDLSIALREKKLYRNFQGYSTNAGTDLYAMGITSISQHGRVYAQNYKTEKEYYSELDKGELPIFKGYLLNDDDILRRHVITKIMCDFELDYNSVSEKFNIDFKKYFAYGIEKVKQFEDDELLSLTDDGFKVTEMGRLLIRNIAMNFDGFIERKEDNAKYSRTV